MADKKATRPSVSAEPGAKITHTPGITRPPKELIEKLAIPGNSAITRGDACRLIYEATRKA